LIGKWSSLLILLLLLLGPMEFEVLGWGWQGGLVVFGRVYQPDGQPAVRAKVRIEIVNGFWREVWSDDQGKFEFRAIPAGRYRLAATNPEVAEQFSEPAESDSTRSFANRLQVDLYLRLPVKVGDGGRPPGGSSILVSVEEAGQKIPGGARKAYEQGMKLQRENEPVKALLQFDRAIEIFPGYYQALTERGNVRMARGLLSEAAGDFEQALRLNARYALALRGLGYCQLQQRQFEAAIVSLEKAYAAAPEVPLTLVLLGYGNMLLDRIGLARQCFVEALRLDEKAAARAHVYLGEIEAKEGNYAAAAEQVRLYLSINTGGAGGTETADTGALRQREEEWRQKAKSAKSMKRD
jgi:tetratricopeptide (TPR) repeat protein